MTKFVTMEKGVIKEVLGNDPLDRKTVKMEDDDPRLLKYYKRNESIQQIAALENTITKRTILEHITGSQEINPKTGKTATQHINDVLDQMDVLRQDL